MKKTLTERDICTQYITPAIIQAGWDLHRQVREEVTFTAGKIIVRGKLHTRGKSKRADYILYHKPNLPIAVIEAKDNKHAISDGMQQALAYAEVLDIPFVFSSNGDGFMEHDRSVIVGVKERELSLNSFPSPEDLWQRYLAWKGIPAEQESVLSQDYYVEPGWKSPRYYQLNAVNKTIEAIAREQKRILLVMATGTGKTFTAFQIIWRLWKSRQKKRILYLADRNILIDQTMSNDFKPFGSVMTKIRNRKVDKSYEIYLALYQGISGTEEFQNIYREFSPDFFDLIVVDECHRGSAAEDSAWREILDYFASATQIGMTATPKETRFVSNLHYFGDPVYTYSLKQGICILQLAVQGRLVPQDPTEEPVAKLLGRIRSEKARLVKEKAIRKTAPLPPVTEDESAYDLPQGWEWVRMSAISESRLGKMLDKAKNKGELRPYLRNTNVQWWRFSLDDIKTMKLENMELGEYKLMPGDLLICEGGEPGRCAIWKGQIEEMYFQKALHRVRPMLGVVSEYLQICLRIDASTSRLSKYFTGATIKHFAGQELARYVIPLPPLAEQHRIVAKIDELMAICDRLEARLTKAKAKVERMTASAVQGLVAI